MSRSSTYKLSGIKRILLALMVLSSTVFAISACGTITTSGSLTPAAYQGTFQK